MDQTGNGSISPQIRNIWKDAYSFHAAFAGMGNTPDDWIRCAKTMAAVSRRNRDHPLAKQLLMAVYCYLEEERKNNGGVASG